MIISAKEIRNKLMQTQDARRVYPKEEWLPTGCTLLNMACSGEPFAGWPPGSYVYIVGDSKSGKTFWALTCMAEACAHKSFQKHRLIYDGGERGAQMDFKKFFGAKMAGKVEPPATKDGVPVPSKLIEDFYYNLDDAIKEKVPFIYVLDSMDALGSKYEDKKFNEGKKAHRANTKAKGDYGDGKAKFNSRNLRAVLDKLEAMGSILIIISQTRDNIDAGMFESKKTRSGGKALRFYADYEIWTSVGSKITKTFRSKDVQIGGHMVAHVQKNRGTGRERKIKLPIYYDHGFDDVGSCVDYLVEWKEWKKNQSGTIKASIPDAEFEMEAKRENIIQSILAEELEDDLSQYVSELWGKIEAKVAVTRKKRYE